MQNNEQILEDVSKVSIQLLLQEPFYGHFFTGLIKKVTKDIDTLAVGYHNSLITLYINSKFWTDSLTNEDFKYGGIKHEILHIVFKHIFRYKSFSQKTIFNVAADIVVNQYVAPNQLIEGAVLLGNFPELNLEPHQHVNHYYNALLDLYNKFADGK
ncbi:MAG TPA: hypothetical protein DCS93_41430, partial [Microscillaceae bacterium]|nr:hypothetical protein [Microscillaceae bacterium]